jgi:conjugative transposon protein
MDYIFAPVSADKAVLESTLSFLDVLQRMMLGKETSRLKGLYLFWNQVDKRETSGLYEKYGQVVADMGLPMLQTRIPDTKRFRKEADGTGRTVFRSTLLAPDRRMLAGSGIPELTREIATILKLEGYEEAAE